MPPRKQDRREVMNAASAGNGNGYVFRRGNTASLPPPDDDDYELPEEAYPSEAIAAPPVVATMTSIQSSVAAAKVNIPAPIVAPKSTPITVVSSGN